MDKGVLAIKNLGTFDIEFKLCPCYSADTRKLVYVD